MAARLCASYAVGLQAATPKPELADRVAPSCSAPSSSWYPVAKGTKGCIVAEAAQGPLPSKARRRRPAVRVEAVAAPEGAVLAKDIAAALELAYREPSLWEDGIPAWVNDERQATDDSADDVKAAVLPSFAAEYVSALEVLVQEPEGGSAASLTRGHRRKRLGLETRVALREQKRDQLGGRARARNGLRKEKGKAVSADVAVEIAPAEDGDLGWAGLSGIGEKWNRGGTASSSGAGGLGDLTAWKSWSLLTREQEERIMQYIQPLRELEAVKADAERTLGRPLTDGEWARAAEVDMATLLKRVELGQAARKRLVECNLRLVMSIANKYRKIAQNLTFEDLCHFGSTGLSRAAVLFDPTKGNRFCSYAYPFVHNSVRRAVYTYGRTISMPFYHTAMTINVKRAQLELLSKLGRFPSDEEVAQHLGVSEKRIQNAQKWHQSPILSLDSATQGLEESVSGDAFVEMPNEAYAEIDAELQDYGMDAVLDSLHPKENQVLRLSLGLDGVTGRSFADVGREMNMSREMVRRYFNRGMLKMQHPERAKMLRAYLG